MRSAIRFRKWFKELFRLFSGDQPDKQLPVLLAKPQEIPDPMNNFMLGMTNQFVERKEDTP